MRIQSGYGEGLYGVGWDSAEHKMLAQLQQRDQTVRDTEKSKGEALGGSAYIYQTGPDGKTYAVGTAPHVVRQEKEAEGTPSARFSGQGLGAAPSTQGNTDKDFANRLAARDREVRAHEQAHIAAAGGLSAGAPTYDYQTGPDGEQYAVGGSVNIVMTSVPGDPDATKRNAAAAERAATAPGSPSGQDFKVAADARSMSARADMEEQRLDEAERQDGAQSALDQAASPASPEWSRAMAAYGRQGRVI